MVSPPKPNPSLHLSSFSKFEKMRRHDKAMALAHSVPKVQLDSIREIEAVMEAGIRESRATNAVIPIAPPPLPLLVLQLSLLIIKLNKSHKAENEVSILVRIELITLVFGRIYTLEIQLTIFRTNVVLRIKSVKRGGCKDDADIRERAAYVRLSSNLV